MYSQRMILQSFFILSLVCLGCSHTRSDRESADALNQTDPSGLKQGPWEIYSDSVLVGKGSYVDGQQEGLWTYWYRSGQMKAEGQYRGGVKDGMWIEWYRDGDIMWKGEWSEGERHVDYSGANVEVSFIGQDHPEHILAADSLYRLRIRIQNIPSSYLFVEVSAGEITREEETGIYHLKTSSDSMFTMAIGYVPDLEFTDFRNLVTEIDFRIE
jgi:hypothetical protein